jgi:hypothetical protein
MHTRKLLPSSIYFKTALAKSTHRGRSSGTSVYVTAPFALHMYTVLNVYTMPYKVSSIHVKLDTWSSWDKIGRTIAPPTIPSETKVHMIPFLCHKKFLIQQLILWLDSRHTHSTNVSTVLSLIPQATQDCLFQQNCSSGVVTKCINTTSLSVSHTKHSLFLHNASLYCQWPQNHMIHNIW